MHTYVLNKKPEPVEMVWAFDLGHPLRLERGEDRGEVSNPDHQKTEVNTIHQFLHKASLLIPAEFAETKTAALVAKARLMQTHRHAVQLR